MKLIQWGALILVMAIPLQGADVPSFPGNFSAYLGDPERGSEPQPKHAKVRKFPELEPVTVNQGNPFTDYGHFRMSNKVIVKKRNVLRLDADIKASKARWQTQPWQDGEKLHYSLAKPLEGVPKPQRGFPLVVLQPGIGGIGKTSAGGQVWISEAHQRLFPSYVLYLHPQARTHEYMTRPDGINNITPTEMIAYYEACIRDVVKTLPDVDPKRVYLVGHSMGGSSTWQLLLRNPQLYAAAAPMAGVPPIDMEEAERIKDVPIWMFIGNDDPWSGSFLYTRTYQNLVKAGARKVRYWEIQDIGHSGGAMTIWPVAVWLFEQSQ